MLVTSLVYLQAVLLNLKTVRSPTIRPLRIMLAKATQFKLISQVVPFALDLLEYKVALTISKTRFKLIQPLILTP